MYLVGWLYFLTSVEWLFLETFCVSQQLGPLWSPELYALWVSPCGLHGSFSCGGLTIVGGLVGVVGPGPVGCQALHCA